MLVRFSYPDDIDVQSLKARFENGVLLIQMNRIKKAIHKLKFNNFLIIKF